MIGEEEMNIFVRYADIAGYPPMPYRVRAYDCRFFFILSGSGKIEIDGTEYRFAPDTLCYYPAGSAYTIIPEEQPRFVSVNFDFTREHTDIPSVMPPVPAESYERKRRLDTQNGCGEDIFISPFVLHGASFLREVLTKAAEEFLCGSEHSENRAAALVQYACYLIPDRHAEGDAGLCARIADYIRANYSGKLTLAGLSEVFSYHPNYLGTVFRNGTGVTVHRYIMNIRLKKASELLAATPLPVAEIASLVGFRNADHFSACFSANCGMSPTEYRSRGFLG